MTVSGGRGARRRLPTVALAVAVLAVGALAFLSDEPSDDVVETLGSVRSVPDPTTDATEPTLPTEIDSPWCAALLDLDRPGGPVGADLAAAYREIASTAPEGLAADLIGAADRIDTMTGTAVEDTVLDDAATDGTTIDDTGDVGDPTGAATLPDDFDAEGRPVEEDPLLRVAEYVESVCRATGSNPGPPPTQPTPAADPTTTLP